MLKSFSLVVGWLVIVAGELPNSDTNGLNSLTNLMVVGGEDAPEGRIPYQAALMTINNDYFCGGTILSNRWILTAAHCVFGQSPKNIVVVVGTNNIYLGGDTYSVESIEIHRNYTDVVKGHDIALIKTSRDIVFNDLVKPIQLPEENTGVVDQVMISGWGRLSANGPRPARLQMLNLTSLTVDECTKRFNGEYEIFERHICTFTKIGEGSCNGDSGSPLVHINSVVGVVSWGIPCAAGSPDVHTRVHYFKDWIQTTMSSEV